MGIFDRIILTIFTFGMAFLSLIFVMMSAGGWTEPLALVQRALADPNGRWTIGVLASLFFIVAVRFIYYGFSRQNPMETVVHETALGEVRISLRAIENLVKKVTRQVKGVRDVRAWVYALQGGVGVRLRTWVSPESNIPEVSEQIQRTVRSYVKNVVGVEANEVRLFVENITNEVRKGRVE